MVLKCVNNIKHGDKSVNNLKHVSYLLLLALKLSQMAGCSPENTLHCVIFAATFYICDFQHDTSNFIKQALPHVHYYLDDQHEKPPSNLFVIKIKCRQ